MTEFEKYIYNTHLACSRKRQNKPYKYRNNFDNIDESTKLYLYKLSKFFNSHKNVNVANFFDAPHIIYADSQYYDLSFYLSLKSVKIYKEYISKLHREGVNSDEMKQFFKNSAKFIVKFCNQCGISFKDYITHKPAGASINIFIQHLKHGNVSIYFLNMYSNFESEYNKIGTELREFVLSENYNLTKFKINYYNSEPSTKEYFKNIFDMCYKNS
jgi:hypothetical protein